MSKALEPAPLKEKLLSFVKSEVGIFFFLLLLVLLVFSGLFSQYITVSDAIWLFDGKRLTLSSLFQPNTHRTIRPVTSLTFALLYRLFHLQFPLYALFNLVLHTWNSWFLYHLTKKLASVFQLKHPKSLGFLSALIFLLYFPHHQSLILIATIHDTLMTALCLLSFWWLLRGGRKSLLLSAFFYALALLTKEPSLALLPVLALFLLMTGSSLARTTLALRAHILLTIVYLFFLLFFVLPQQVALAHVPPLETLQIILFSLKEFALTSFVIFHYKYFHYYRLQFPLQNLLLLFSQALFFLSLILLSTSLRKGALARLRKAGKWLFFAVAFFLLTFFPNAFSKEVFWQQVIHLARFRFYYLPSVGGAWILAYFFSLLYFTSNRKKIFFLSFSQAFCLLKVWETFSCSNSMQRAKKTCES